MTETILHWHKSGNPAGSPLILLHGFIGNGADWTNIIEGLPNNNCYSPDLPGHGKSIQAVALSLKNIEAVANAIIHDMDLLGIERCALLGYSMGGRIALYLALRNPERFTALILESVSPGIESLAERTQRFVKDSGISHRLREMDSDLYLFNDFLQEWYDAPIFCTMEDRPGFDDMVISRLDLNTAFLARALEMMGIGQQQNLWPELPSLKMPTLVIVGAKDTKYCEIAEQMVSAYPVITLQIFNDCSHNVHWEIPSEYTNVVRAFLARANLTHA